MPAKRPSAAPSPRKIGDPEGRGMTRWATRVVVGALFLGAPVAQSAPLDKASCDKLKSEQAQLEQDGVRGTMAKGPVWAKANLQPEQLGQVHRLIEIDGQLLFRCQGRPLVELPKETEADPAAVGEEPKDAAPNDAAPKDAAPKVAP